MLIWKHKQVGRVYDFYFDGLKEERDGGDNLEGSDHVVLDTLRALALDAGLERGVRGDPLHRQSQRRFPFRPGGVERRHHRGRRGARWPRLRPGL